MSDFWSRRKAAVQAEQKAEERAEEEVQLAEREAELAEQSDEDILEELGLPDPDTLSEGDDFTGFLAKTVPARIRQRALRKLWLTNPVLANVDGLVDYGEDFTDASMVIEGMQTTYQVGKGMLRHVEEMARQAEAEEQALQEPQELDASLEEPEDADVQPDIDPVRPPEPFETPTPVLTHAAVEYDVEYDAEDDIEPVDQAPRRMRFVFEETGNTT